MLDLDIFESHALFKVLEPCQDMLLLLVVSIIVKFTRNSQVHAKAGQGVGKEPRRLHGKASHESDPLRITVTGSSLMQNL